MTVNPFASQYNPFAPVPGYGYGGGILGGPLPSGPAYTGPTYDELTAPEAPAAEEQDVDAAPAIDPNTFNDIDVAVRFTPGKEGNSIDVAFNGLDLDWADDFFRYLGTEAGLNDLSETILVAFAKSGVISQAQALATILGL